ncbi:MAG: hypothetical protein KDI44_13100 [Thiothrix sp.]|nr:hypothetical protein [Thiothrix sp.]HPQ94706.1 hypothetical protein [Thiolinea sp.]
MKPNTFFAALITATLFASSAAMAGNSSHDSKQYDKSKQQTSHRVAPQPQHKKVVFSTAKLEQRIAHGVKTGSLTRTEHNTLNRELASLKATIKQVNRDRKVTTRERQQVEKKESRLSRLIQTLSSNRAVVRAKQSKAAPKHNGKQLVVISSTGKARVH